MVKSGEQQLHGKFNRYFFSCLIIGAFIISPYLAITGATEYWKYLFGNKAIGAFNWIISVPTPFISIFMSKIENTLSIKKRLLVSWIGQITVDLFVILVPYMYFKNKTETSDPFTAHFIAFSGLVMLTAIFFAVSQASFLSFASLLPVHFVEAVVSGMAFGSLFYSILWLALSLSIDYKKNPLPILSIFCGSAIVCMCGSITLFFYIRSSEFYKKIAVEEKKDITKFNELVKVFKKIKLQMILIFLLMAANFLLSPTLCYGYKPHNKRWDEKWGAVLMLTVSFSNASSRIFMHYKLSFFEWFLERKRITKTIIINSVAAIMISLPIWLAQTGNFGKNIPRGWWLDVVVVVIYIEYNFLSGLLFTKLMVFANNDCDSNEKQSGSILMISSYTVGILVGYLAAFLINLLNSSFHFLK